MSLMKMLNKRGLRNLYLPFEIVPINSFEQILSHWKKSHTHLVWQVINCDYLSNVFDRS